MPDKSERNRTVGEKLQRLVLIGLQMTANKGTEYFHPFIIKVIKRRLWVAQSVKCPTSAQVMILRFVSLSPALGSVLIAQSPEPASDSLSPSFSSPAHALSLLKNKR